MRGPGRSYIRRIYKKSQGLTERRLQVLLGIVNCETIKETAFRLGISHKTAEYHRANAMKFLGIQSVAGLTRWAISHGLLSLLPTNGIVRLQIDESRREELEKLIREPKHQ